MKKEEFIWNESIGYYYSKGYIYCLPPILNYQMGVYDWYYLLYPDPPYTHIKISCSPSWTYVQLRLESKKWCYFCTFIPRALDTRNGIALVQNPLFNFHVRYIYQTYMSWERLYKLTTWCTSHHDWSSACNDFLVFEAY